MNPGDMRTIDTHVVAEKTAAQREPVTYPLSHNMVWWRIWVKAPAVCLCLSAYAPVTTSCIFSCKITLALRSLCWPCMSKNLENVRCPFLTYISPKHDVQLMLMVAFPKCLNLEKWQLLCHFSGITYKFSHILILFLERIEFIFKRKMLWGL